MDRGHVDTRHGASLFKARYTSGGPWALVWYFCVRLRPYLRDRVSDDCVNCVCLVACIIRWYHESLRWAKMIRSCRLVGHHFGTVPLVLLHLLANPELERKWKYAGAWKNWENCHCQLSIVWPICQDTLRHSRIEPCYCWKFGESDVCKE